GDRDCRKDLLLDEAESFGVKRSRRPAARKKFKLGHYPPAPADRSKRRFQSATDQLSLMGCRRPISCPRRPARYVRPPLPRTSLATQPPAGRRTGLGRTLAARSPRCPVRLRRPRAGHVCHHALSAWRTVATGDLRP